MLPHSKAAPQRAQARRRGFASARSCRASWAAGWPTKRAAGVAADRAYVTSAVPEPEVRTHQAANAVANFRFKRALSHKVASVLHSEVRSRACCKVGRTSESGQDPFHAKGTPHDRSLLLDHAERPQDHDFSRRDRTAVQDFPHQHRKRGAIRQGLSEGRPEQPYSRDGRSRAGGRRRAARDVRVGRDAALSRRQDEEVHPAGSARTQRGDRMAVLADGQSRARTRDRTITSTITRSTRFLTRWTVTATR